MQSADSIEADPDSCLAPGLDFRHVCSVEQYETAQGLFTSFHFCSVYTTSNYCHSKNKAEALHELSPGVN